MNESGSIFALSSRPSSTKCIHIPARKLINGGWASRPVQNVQQLLPTPASMTKQGLERFCGEVSSRRNLLAAVQTRVVAPA